MPHLPLANVTLDVQHMDRAVAFWTRALHYSVLRRDEHYAALEHPSDPRRLRLGLQPTDSPKHGPNRMHVDLETDEWPPRWRAWRRSGRRARDWAYPGDGDGADRNWVVMRDPDENEFCVTERAVLKFA